MIQEKLTTPSRGWIPSSSPNSLIQQIICLSKNRREEEELWIVNPIEIPGIQSSLISSFQTNGKADLALTENGTVLVRGTDRSKDGFLGLGNDNFESSKFQTLPSLQGKKIVQISLGPTHAAVVDIQGNLFLWGRGTNGQLAQLDSSSQNIKDESFSIPQETSLRELRGNVKQVICKRTQTIVLTKNGNIIVLGNIEGIEAYYKSQKDNPYKQKNQIQYSWQSFQKMCPEDEWGGCAVTKKGDIIFWNKYFMTEKLIGKSQIDDIFITKGKLFALQKECVLEWDLNSILKNTFFSSRQRQSLDLKIDCKFIPPKEYLFSKYVRTSKFVVSPDGKSLALFIESENNQVFQEPNSFWNTSKIRKEANDILSNKSPQERDLTSLNSFLMGSSIEKKVDYFSPESGINYSSLISPRNNISTIGNYDRPQNASRPIKSFLGNIQIPQASSIQSSSSSSLFNINLPKFQGSSRNSGSIKIVDDFNKVNRKLGWYEQIDKSIDYPGKKSVTEESSQQDDTYFSQKMRTQGNYSSLIGGNINDRENQTKQQIQDQGFYSNKQIPGPQLRQQQILEARSQEEDFVKKQRRQIQGEFDKQWKNISKKPEDKSKQFNQQQQANGKDLSYFLSLIQQGDKTQQGGRGRGGERGNYDFQSGNTFLKTEGSSKEPNNMQKSRGYLSQRINNQEYTSNQSPFGMETTLIEERNLFSKLNSNTFFDSFKQLARQNQGLRIEEINSFRNNNFNQRTQNINPLTAAQKGFCFIDSNGCRIQPQGQKQKQANNQSSYSGMNNLLNYSQEERRYSQRQSVQTNRNNFQNSWNILNKSREELNHTSLPPKTLINSFYSDRRQNVARSLNSSAMELQKRQSGFGLNTSNTSAPRTLLGEMNEQQERNNSSKPYFSNLPRYPTTNKNQSGLNIYSNDVKSNRSQSPSFQRYEEDKRGLNGSGLQNRDTSENFGSQNLFKSRRGSFGIENEENILKAGKFVTNQKERVDSSKYGSNNILPPDISAPIVVKEEEIKRDTKSQQTLSQQPINLLSNEKDSTELLSNQEQKDKIIKSEKAKGEEFGIQVDFNQYEDIEDSRARKNSVGNQTAFSDEEVNKSKSIIIELQQQLEQKLTENEKLKNLMKQKEQQDKIRKTNKNVKQKDEQNVKSSQQQGMQGKDPSPKKSHTQIVKGNKKEEKNNEKGSPQKSLEKDIKDPNAEQTQGSILDLSCSDVEDVRRDDEDEDEGDFDDINPVLLSHEEMASIQNRNKRDILNDHPDFLLEEGKEEIDQNDNQKINSQTKQPKIQPSNQIHQESLRGSQTQKVKSQTKNFSKDLKNKNDTKSKDQTEYDNNHNKINETKKKDKKSNQASNDCEDPAEQDDQELEQGEVQIVIDDELDSNVHAHQDRLEQDKQNSYQNDFQDNQFKKKDKNRLSKKLLQGNIKQRYENQQKIQRKDNSSQNPKIKVKRQIQLKGNDIQSNEVNDLKVSQLNKDEEFEGDEEEELVGEDQEFEGEECEEFEGGECEAFEEDEDEENEQEQEDNEINEQSESQKKEKNGNQPQQSDQKRQSSLKNKRSNLNNQSNEKLSSDKEQLQNKMRVQKQQKQNEISKQAGNQPKRNSKGKQNLVEQGDKQNDDNENNDDEEEVGRENKNQEEEIFDQQDSDSEYENERDEIFNQQIDEKTESDEDINEQRQQRGNHSNQVKNLNQQGKKNILKQEFDNISVNQQQDEVQQNQSGKQQSNKRKQNFSEVHQSEYTQQINQKQKQVERDNTIKIQEQQPEEILINDQYSTEQEKYALYPQNQKLNIDNYSESNQDYGIYFYQQRQQLESQKQKQHSQQISNSNSYYPQTQQSNEIKDQKQRKNDLLIKKQEGNYSNNDENQQQDINQENNQNLNNNEENQSSQNQKNSETQKQNYLKKDSLIKQIENPYSLIQNDTKFDENEIAQDFGEKKERDLLTLQSLNKQEIEEEILFDLQAELVQQKLNKISNQNEISPRKLLTDFTSSFCEKMPSSPSNQGGNRQTNKEVINLPKQQVNQINLIQRGNDQHLQAYENQEKNNERQTQNDNNLISKDQQISQSSQRINQNLFQPNSNEKNNIDGEETYLLNQREGQSDQISQQNSNNQKIQSNNKLISSLQKNSSPSPISKTHNLNQQEDFQNLDANTQNKQILSNPSALESSPVNQQIKKNSNSKQSPPFVRSFTKEEENSNALFQSLNPQMRQSFDPSLLAKSKQSLSISKQSPTNRNNSISGNRNQSNEGNSRNIKRSSSLRYSDICQNFDNKFKKAHQAEKNKAIERATGIKVSQYSEAGKGSLNNSQNRSGILSSQRLSTSTIKKSGTNFFQEDPKQKQELLSSGKYQDSFSHSFEPNDPQFLKSQSTPEGALKIKNFRENNADSMVFASGAISPIPNSNQDYFSSQQFLQEAEQTYQDLKKSQFDSPTINDSLPQGKNVNIQEVQAMNQIQNNDEESNLDKESSNLPNQRDQNDLKQIEQPLSLEQSNPLQQDNQGSEISRPQRSEVGTNQEFKEEKNSKQEEISQVINDNLENQEMHQIKNDEPNRQQNTNFANDPQQQEKKDKEKVINEDRINQQLVESQKNEENENSDDIKQDQKYKQNELLRDNQNDERKIINHEKYENQSDDEVDQKLKLSFDQDEKNTSREEQEQYSNDQSNKKSLPSQQQSQSGSLQYQKTHKNTSEQMNLKPKQFEESIIKKERKLDQQIIQDRQSQLEGTHQNKVNNFINFEDEINTQQGKQIETSQKGQQQFIINNNKIPINHREKEISENQFENKNNQCNHDEEYSNNQFRNNQEKEQQEIDILKEKGDLADSKSSQKQKEEFILEQQDNKSSNEENNGFNTFSQAQKLKALTSYNKDILQKMNLSSQGSKEDKQLSLSNQYSEQIPKVEKSISFLEFKEKEQQKKYQTNSFIQIENAQKTALQPNNQQIQLNQPNNIIIKDPQLFLQGVEDNKDKKNIKSQKLIQPESNIQSSDQLNLNSDDSAELDQEKIIQNNNNNNNKINNQNKIQQSSPFNTNLESRIEKIQLKPELNSIEQPFYSRAQNNLVALDQNIPSREQAIDNLYFQELVILPENNTQKNQAHNQISQNGKICLVLSLRVEKFQLKRKFQAFQKLRLQFGYQNKSRTLEVQNIPQNILRFKGGQINKVIIKTFKIFIKKQYREFFEIIKQKSDQNLTYPEFGKAKFSAGGSGQVSKLKMQLPQCLALLYLRRKQQVFELIKFWDNSIRPTIDQDEYFIEQKNLNQIRQTQVTENPHLFTPERKSRKQMVQGQKLQRATSDSTERLALIQQKARNSQQYEQLKKTQVSHDQIKKSAIQGEEEDQQNTNKQIPQYQEHSFEEKKDQLNPTISNDFEQQGYQELLKELQQNVNAFPDKNAEEENCEKPLFAPDYADPKEFEPDSYQKFSKNLNQEELQIVEQLLHYNSKSYPQKQNSIKKQENKFNSGNTNLDSLELEPYLQIEGKNFQQFEKYLNQYNLNLSQSQSNYLIQQKLKASNSLQQKEDEEGQEGEYDYFMNQINSNDQNSKQSMQYLTSGIQYALIPERLQPGYLYKEKNKLLKIAPIVNYADIREGAVDNKRLDEKSLNNPPPQSLPGYDKIINAQKEFIAKKFQNLHNQKVTGNKIIQNANETTGSPPLNSTLNSPQRNLKHQNSMYNTNNVSGSIHLSPRASKAMTASNRLYEDAKRSQQRHNSEQPKLLEQKSIKSRQQSQKHSNSFQASKNSTLRNSIQLN